jgi:glycosyltransferase involved in cell wall biosynthesis
MPKILKITAIQGRAEALPAWKVSIVIVCYNQAHYLREAIESALAQTFPDIEVLVIDDGSTDNTAKVASSFPDIRYFPQRNQGLAAARNTGIRQSEGNYIVFLDADDRLLPDAIETGLILFHKRPELGFVYGGYRRISKAGTPLPTPEPDRVDGDYYWHLLRGNIVGMHAAVMYSRAALTQVGGFDSRLRACEDYDLYLRMARRWPVCRHDGCVAEYRQHDQNMSADPAFMLESVLKVLKLERKRVPDRRHRLALRTGSRAWKEYYANRQIENWKRQRNWRGFLRLFRQQPFRLVRRGVRFLRRRTFSEKVEWSGLRRLEPLSRKFGWDRGRPVDRYYIEQFLSNNLAAVKGRVLEIGDDSYSRQFGGARIDRQDVLHIIPGHPGATIISDLANAPELPPATFDCIIFTQTLHYIFRTEAALATLARILKPGGTLLLTVPGISAVCRDQADLESDCWRFTVSSLRKLLSLYFPPSYTSIRSYGNVLAATAFLYGMAVHELTGQELDHLDPDFPVIIAAATVKPPEG